MPGQNHEDIIDFVVHDARGVLDYLELDLPNDIIISAKRGLDLSESTPKQLLADGRIVIGNPPMLGLVIEAQSTMTEAVWTEKQLKWPHYAMALRTELKCVTETLVITTDARIEKMARQCGQAHPTNFYC